MKCDDCAHMYVPYPNEMMCSLGLKLDENCYAYNKRQKITFDTK